MNNQVLGDYIKQKYSNKPLKPMAQRRKYRKMTYYEVEIHIKGRAPWELVREIQEKRREALLKIGNNMRNAFTGLAWCLSNKLKPIMENLKQIFTDPRWEPLIIINEEGIRPGDAENKINRIRTMPILQMIEEFPEIVRG